MREGCGDFGGIRSGGRKDTTFNDAGFRRHGYDGYMIKLANQYGNAVLALTMATAVESNRWSEATQIGNVQARPEQIR